MSKKYMVLVRCCLRNPTVAFNLKSNALKCKNKTCLRNGTSSHRSLSAAISKSKYEDANLKFGNRAPPSQVVLWHD